MEALTTPEQIALANYMMDLSNEAYDASWMMGLEFALWEVREGTRTRYGNLDVEPEQAAKLKALSEACGGWLYWGEDGDPENWGVRFAPFASAYVVTAVGCGHRWLELHELANRHFRCCICAYPLHGFCLTLGIEQPLPTDPLIIRAD